MPTPVVLDCDPGHDDAIAILLAAGSPEIDLRAITTVAANQTLDKVTSNAQRLCTAAGISVPIARGSAQPLVRPLHVAEDIHGESGMDGPAFGEVTVGVVPEHAIDLMHAHMPATLVATGALTNVALYLLRHGPSAVREIVLMGGSTERGNTTPYAEFNIYVDPEAAAIVFASGVPITMIGLNVTHQALVTPEIVTQLNALGPLGRICGDLMTFFATTYRDVFGFAAPPLHDPVAVARVIDPALVTCVEAFVGIETTGTFTRGATVVDLHGRLGRAPNARVAVGLDVDGFFDLVLDAVRRLT
ncbi:nucleoside hydrolase [Lentzea sp. NBRC 102530]|uniref:nucleoside hydrolase n=1 Tax=Lentzea sp. NBRC 102530 TaxID=3032201 RepID=UPI0024A3681C|nr:nucleoside hydrolase [Lentzea sp. NBRC 102530]GLY49626.1 pyrimidine-specific ribonucleoside hydrolase RihA [Lentzea sp. NBRC 102530]